MNKFLLIALCSLWSLGLYAQNDTVAVKTDKYTFGDFFDALDLPTVLGVGITPNGIESATFNSAMRLGWRHHKNYGTFVYITYDTHSNSYDSLMIEGSNVCKGEVWYNEIGMSVGYRFPLVKDIKAFYETPYFHPWDMYISVQPGVSIATIKNFEVFDGTGNELTYYEMQSQNHVVPTMRFTVGVEWFVFPNFSVFAEAAYTQHVMPTIIEQTAIHQKQIQNPSGPITFSLGLSLFFK
jgi:hypothetical protein